MIHTFPVVCLNRGTQADWKPRPIDGLHFCDVMNPVSSWVHLRVFYISSDQSGTGWFMWLLYNITESLSITVTYRTLGIYLMLFLLLKHWQYNNSADRLHILTMEFRFHFQGNLFKICGRYCDAGRIYFLFVLVCVANHHSTGVIAYRHGMGWIGLRTDVRGHEVVAGLQVYIGKKDNIFT